MGGCIQRSGCLLDKVLLQKVKGIFLMWRIKLESCGFVYTVSRLLSLTTEGGIPPADGDSSTLAGLSVGLHIVTESLLHAIIFTHVVEAVTQEPARGHHRVTGLKAIRQDDL